MNKLKLTTLALLSLLSVGAWGQTSQFCDMASAKNEPQPVYPVPNERQLAWMDLEFYAFMHFGINTFTNLEWGTGSESINTFSPTAQVNVQQWVTNIKNAGMKGIVLTCKHHDGFCTWFTNTTSHTTKNNTTTYGHIDIPALLSAECKAQGLKFGAYISPWDRNNAEYGREGYIETFREQIREVCTNYGELFEMWFDGANGGSGYYGGTNETRSIDADVYYDFANTFKIIRELQPNCAIWGWDQDCHWVGNEEGWAGETNWATFANGANGNEYGDEDGWRWLPNECDAKNGDGWFWNTTADANVKTAAQMFNIYMSSVGRGSNLILNFPPNKAGVLSTATVNQLTSFKALMDAAFGTDYALTGTATASDVRSGGLYAASNVNDGDPETYWALEDGQTTGYVDIDLGTTRTVKYIRLGEYVRKGQRVKGFKVYTWNGTSWVEQTMTTATTTIGHHRIVQLASAASTQKVRVEITDCKVCPLINRISIY